MFDICAKQSLSLPSSIRDTIFCPCNLTVDTLFCRTCAEGIAGGVVEDMEDSLGDGMVAMVLVRYGDVVMVILSNVSVICCRLTG